jgi:ribosomal protein S18 acetylase RimI-like enzyme
MNSFIYRQLTSDDWQTFKNIRILGLTQDPRAFGRSLEDEVSKDEKYWRDRLSDSERLHYGAFLNNKLVAVGGLKKISDDNYMIVAVYTIPEYRKQGISTHLIELLLEYIKEKSIHIASLMVNKAQTSAVDMYIHMGFVTVKEEDHSFGDGVVYPALYMEKVVK